MKTISFKYIIVICFVSVLCTKTYAQSEIRTLLSNGGTWHFNEDFIKIDDDNTASYAGILFNKPSGESPYHNGYDPYILVQKDKLDQFTTLKKFRLGMWGRAEDYYHFRTTKSFTGNNYNWADCSYMDFFTFDLYTSNTVLGQLGNVGIGNETPHCRLDVGTDNATSTSTLLHVHGSAHFNNDLGTTAATMTKVSINTDTNVPGCALTVAGPTYIGDWSTIEHSTVNADYIGTYNLWVDKGVVSPDFVLSDVSEWADDVFEPEYNLPTLKEVEQYVSENGHLHGVPSAKEVKENGYSVAKLNTTLLRKVEELTVYAIAMEKKASNLQQQLDELNELKNELKELKTSLQK